PHGRLRHDQAGGPEGRPGLARAGGGALPEDRRREARREAAEGGSMRAAFALLALLPAAAWAQMPTVDPSGREPAAPPPTAAPGSSTGVPGGIYGIDRPAPAPQPPEIRVVVPPGGQVEQEGKSGKAKELEGLWIAPHRRAAAKQPPAATLVPETYVVQSGDTLWDICSQFLGDPYLWPTSWAQN